MSLLNRDAILESASRLKHELVHVPEWDGDVLVWGMSGSERDAFESQFIASQKSTIDLRAKLAAVCIRDENGVRLFNDQDIEAIGKTSGAALARIADVAMRLSGMTKQDVAELEKN